MKEQILKLRAEGKTYNEIKKLLGCSKGTISYHCGAGVKEKSRKNKIKHHASLLQTKNSTRRYLKEFVRRHKTMCGCKHCGIKNPIVLDYDHIDKATKEHTMSEVVHSGHSLELVKIEARKCQVLCSNCHRIKTHNMKDHNASKY
ncbi:MAG: helix-turn-helix domain-containing protein [Gammaproteobacteria bacterium]|nr:helix-turn-helix domain-containing protein [Gammaproteobacteria bacterium]